MIRMTILSLKKTNYKTRFIKKTIFCVSTTITREVGVLDNIWLVLPSILAQMASPDINKQG